ncbi:hypothetical protein ACRQ5D_09040 [Mucilaginibacter sp. P25]|jgi:hypothetical protein|uniref:Uncharacterized protein n=1 Tax=Mucilaginibacter gossypii TaxID=551996 RepID=A0A1G8HT94_9SPHI|nr:hypothetical protein [Mucilaginibacter gossypii]SDI09720.1 hypothetical protein SAMN05192573_11620 [Mucilaginibacter gossypii]
MRAIDGIKSSIRNKDHINAIARKLYLSHYTEIFKDNGDKEFYIKDKIAAEFDVPFSSIAVSGSSKTGISFFKEKLFVPGDSDLDIAIISLPLFNRFSEVVNDVSKGYSDFSAFPLYRGRSSMNQFKFNFMRGYINPVFMPDCDYKYWLIDFFNSLSNEHFDLFKNITGCIYASEYFFEFKQAESIELYLRNTEKYDKISSKV